MFFCADSVHWRRMPRAWPPMSTMMMSLCSMYQSHQESSAGWTDRAGQELIIVEAVSKGFVLQGFVWPLLYTFPYPPFQYFLGHRASGLDQLCGTATMLQTLLDPVVVCASPLCRVKLLKFSSLLWSSFFFFFPLTSTYFLLFSPFSHFFVFIVYCLIGIFFFYKLVS